MSPPLIALFLWFVLAHVLALLPSRDNHWTRAYVLIALGVPLLGWITASHGPVVGLIAFAGGASVLRWPLIFLGRWVMRRLGRDEGERTG